MASIDMRKRQQDQVWRVRWREATEPQAEEFTDRADAEVFCALVTATGNKWPSPAALYARGLHAVAAKRETLLATPAVRDIPLVEWCREYIRTESQASKEEKKRYQAMVTNHLAEYFGAILVGQVTGRMIRDWQDHMADHDAGPGLSGKTIKNVRCSVLAPALAAAARPDLDGNPPMIAHNPCLAIRAPKAVSNRPEVWTQPEVDAMLTAALDIDPRAYAVLATLAGTAMRWSEVVALTTHALYPDRGLLEVRRVAYRTANRWQLREAPKTRHGFRTVPAPDAVLTLLGDQGAPDGGLLLTDAGAGLWVYDAFFRNQWEKIRAAVRAAGYTRRLTLHGLRHTAATRLAESGVDIYTLSAMLGHSPGTTATMYGHATGANNARAAAALATLVGTAA